MQAQEVPGGILQGWGAVLQDGQGMLLVTNQHLVCFSSAWSRGSENRGTEMRVVSLLSIPNDPLVKCWLSVLATLDSVTGGECREEGCHWGTAMLGLHWNGGFHSATLSFSCSWSTGKRRGLHQGGMVDLDFSEEKRWLLQSG